MYRSSTPSIYCKMTLMQLVTYHARTVLIVAGLIALANVFLYLQYRGGLDSGSAGSESTTEEEAYAHPGYICPQPQAPSPPPPESPPSPPSPPSSDAVALGLFPG